MDSIPTTIPTVEPRLPNIATVATIGGPAPWHVKHLHRAGRLRGRL